MFDLDALVADCTAAVRDPEPRLAVRDVLDRAVAAGSGLVDALPPVRSEMVRLHVSDELTVLQLVWGPGMDLWPHDHRMWAAIGIYTGAEDNTFYRRDGSGLVESGGRSLHPGDVCLLGDDVVHGVRNPTRQLTAAIHVYGGDFFTTPRSEWHGDPWHEEPFRVERALALFEAANAALGHEGPAGT